jgi:hypothetical protein
MERFVRHTESVDLSGTIISESELNEIVKNLSESKTHKPGYTSVFSFNADVLDYFSSHFTSKGTKGSLSGFQGEAIANHLIFDLDCESNLDRSYDDAKVLIKRLIDEYKFKEDSISVFFSGGKGFHVKVRISDELTSDQLKAICSHIAKGVDTFDPKIYNKTRLIRIVNTKHEKTGLYKVEIPIVGFLAEDSTIDYIKDFAKEPQEILEHNPSFLPEELLKLAPKVAHNVIAADVNISDARLLDYGKKPKDMPYCKYAILNGFFGQGTRNDCLLSMAAFYKNQGYPIEITNANLNAVVEVQEKRYPTNDHFTREQVWNTIISSVYGPNWKGGVPNCKTDATLKAICESTGMHEECIGSSKENLGIQTIEQMGLGYIKYINTLETNIIKTGIDFLDKSTKLVKGSSNYVVGRCFDETVMVQMADGTKKSIRDIQVGEEVLAYDILMRTTVPSKVTQKWNNGVRKVYKYKFHGGNELNSTENHKILTHYSGTHRPTVKKSIDEADSAYEPYGLSLNLSKKVKNAWILGALIGDGSFTQETLKFACKNKDIENYFKSKIPEGYHLNCVDKENGKFLVCKINGRKGQNEIMNQVREMGLKNKKAWDKFVPKEIMSSDNETVAEFLNGIFCTDGSMIKITTHGFTRKRKKILQGFQISLSNSSLSLLKDVKSLLLRFGIHSALKADRVGDKKKKDFHHDTWQLRINIQEHISKFIECIGIAGKEKKYDPSVICYHKMIEGIKKLKISKEYIGEKQTYDITIDHPDHVYIANDLIVSNSGSGKTTLLLSILKNTNTNNINSLFFSADTSAIIIYQRMIASVTGLSQNEVEHLYKSGDKKKIAEYKEKVREVYGKTTFNVKSTLTFDIINNSISEVENNLGKELDFIVLDYNERIMNQFSDPLNSVRHTALNLVDTASILNKCFLTVAQVSRNKGDEKTPLLSKNAAKESGAVEESASVVATIWRPLYGTEDDKVMGICLPKNRLGRDGIKDLLYFDGDKALVRDTNADEKYKYKQIIEANDAQNENGYYND